MIYCFPSVRLTAIYRWHILAGNINRSVLYCDVALYEFSNLFVLHLLVCRATARVIGPLFFFLISFLFLSFYVGPIQINKQTNKQTNIFTKLIGVEGSWCQTEQFRLIAQRRHDPRMTVTLTDAEADRKS